MAVTIKHVVSKDELKDFVYFGIKLYEGNDYFVPPLVYDELATLNPRKNPAFEHCDAACFLAYRHGEIVGRIAVIINHKANRIWKQRQARFGFVDFIDDNEVVDALFNTAEEWARFRGMEKIHGPLGFSDMDHEGMLIKGFDRIGTLSTIYNYPYYVDHMNRMGYVKDQDWFEYLIKIPDRIPERYIRASEIVKKRFGLQMIHPKDKKETMTYANDIFGLINRGYRDLYGYVELTQKQIDYYADMYLPMLRLEFLSLVIRQEDNKLVGVGIGLPSLAKALQKAKGRFLPTGWIELYRALKGKNEVLDLLLVAVDPEYQGKGINAMMFNQFILGANRLGMKYAESNLELEDNNKVQSMWKNMDAEQHKQRRAFIKEL